MNNKNKIQIVFFFVFGFFILANVASAETYIVGPGREYQKISTAINVASPLDTIRITPGVYDESLFIDKPLNIIGSGVVVITGNGLPYIVKVENTDGVSIDNLEINGGENNSLDYGILLNNSGSLSSPVELSNLVIKNIWNKDSSGVGIENNSYSIINTNTIISFQKNAIRFIKSSGIVENSIVRGDKVDGISRVQNLINIRNGSDVEIRNNVLSRAFTISPSSRSSTSTCVFVNAYMDGLASSADIHDNEISFCDIGVLVTSKLVKEDYSRAILENNIFEDVEKETFKEKKTGTIKFIEEVKVNEEIKDTIDAEEEIGIVEEENFSGVETEDLILPEIENETGNALPASVMYSVATLGTGSTSVGFFLSMAMLAMSGYFVSRKIN